MRRVFFSFDWDDVWRANQVRHSWVAKGNYTAAGFANSAEIETLKKETDAAIKSWIDSQLNGTSVTCVLIGSQTANSKWVKYERDQSIDRGNGLVGIYIHNVKNMLGCTSCKGNNPFEFPLVQLKLLYATKSLLPCLYDWVNDNGYKNLGSWIEKAAQQAGR